MRLASIPLTVPTESNQVGVGTGFLVRSIVGTVYLMTAAHLATGAPTTADWSKWSPEIRTQNAGTSTPIWLFRSTAFGSPAPLFGHHRYEPGKTSIADIIWIDLAHLADQSDELLATFAVHDLVPTLVPHGTRLVAQGYPKTADQWPTLAYEAGIALRRNGSMLESDLTTEQGMSGGPVLTSDGVLRGMVIGSNLDAEAAARIIPADIIFRLLHSE